MTFLFRNKWWVLVLLWLLATALNLTKAFHIDDTFHLEAAQWIEQHPSQPLSGFILWDYGYAPMYEYNQPPLYFYLIALAGHYFGYHEVPLHLVQSVFTGLAIFYFYQIARLVAPNLALWSTAFFVINPVFLINQNVMVDVPVLSLQLIFMYLLLQPEVKSDWVRYGLAGVVLSLALLIKYTSLPFLVIWLVHLLIQKKFKYVAALLVPGSTLLLWSVSNYLEYGAVHLLRPTYSFTWSRIGLKLITFLVTLGGLMPFAIAYYAGYLQKYYPRWLWFLPLLVVLLVGLFGLTFLDIISENNARRALWLFCFGNVLTTVYLILYPFWSQKIIKNLKKFSQSKQLILLLWGFGVSSFIILFAHFMASRHILLALPVIILLAAHWLVYPTNKFKILALAVTGTSSLWLGVSDYVFADTYRQAAQEVKNKLPARAQLYTVGYWGWKWYSQQAGIEPYVAGKSRVKQNDYFVLSTNLPHQKFKNQANLKLLDERIIRKKINFFSGSTIPGMYSSNYANPPFKLSKLPLDTIRIYQVIKSF